MTEIDEPNMIWSFQYGALILMLPVIPSILSTLQFKGIDLELLVMS